MEQPSTVAQRICQYLTYLIGIQVWRHPFQAGGNILHQYRRHPGPPYQQQMKTCNSRKTLTLLVAVRVTVGLASPFSRLHVCNMLEVSINCVQLKIVNYCAVLSFLISGSQA